MKNSALGLLIFGLCSAGVVWAEIGSACSIEAPVVATYRIRVEVPGGVTENTLQLWRYKNQVAIRYPKSLVTEIWEKTKNNRLHLVKIFEKHKKGIEYQPFEISGSHDWSVKRQLVSNEAISKMNLTQSAGKGCNLIKNYSIQTNKGVRHLAWLENQALIKSYRETNDQRTTAWTLLSTSTKQQEIWNKFSALNSYDTIDYTDIGDNESDPFLTSMINFGFIENHSHGFYDSQGNTVHKH